MKFFFLSICFCLSNLLFAQEFPKSFIGNWSGELLWYKQGSKPPQKVKMQLVILPTDTVDQYTWQIIYGEKKEDTRPYVLKSIDTAKGHWRIDERNGIIIDQYWLGKKFSGAFTVQGSTIINTYYISNNQLIVEFFSTASKPISTTGNTSKDIPPVDSYEMRSYQKAILKRKK